VIELAIHEGRNRQVRRMLEAIGHRAVALHRPSYGPLSLGTLAAGHVRRLTAAEVAALQRAAGRT
jgi:23S rRNA pseudouridine2605 synthase